MNAVLKIITLSFSLSGLVSALATDTPSSVKLKSNRSSITTKFGSGTIERRSDGSIVRSVPFGSKSRLIKDSSGGGTSGVAHTQHGTTITRWSDGSTSREYTSGKVQISIYTDKRLKITSRTIPLGRLSITNRSTGTHTIKQQFGSSTLSREFINRNK